MGIKQSTCTFRRWLEFGLSLLLCVVVGWFLSFNVFSVDLKRQFNFTQTQVELLASAYAVGTTLLSIVGSAMIHKFGIRTSYIVGALLIVFSGVMMWTATLHKPFFRDWVGLMCVFSTAGCVSCSIGLQAVILLNLQLFPYHHGGKVIAVLMTFSTLGKIYYSGLYELFFQPYDQLGLYFLMTPIPIAILFIISSALYSPETQEASEKQPLTGSDVSGTQRKYNSGDDGKHLLLDAEDITLGDIFRSGFFHLVTMSSGLLQACVITFVNNVTSFAESTAVSNPINVVYLLSIGMVVFRIVLGVLYDTAKTLAGAMSLILLSYLTFSAGMLIGFLWLNDVTIYAVSVLATVGVGGGMSLTTSLLRSAFGMKYLLIITSYVKFVMAAVSIGAQLFVGVAYDNNIKDVKSAHLNCERCFVPTFVLLFALSSTASLLLAINLLCLGKPSSAA